MITRSLLFSVVVALAGCGAVAESDVVEEAAQGGCKQVCPKCKPGQVCPMIKCYQDCHGAAQPCGPANCHGGEVCCNESCGICTAPGEMCSDLFCPSASQPHSCPQMQLCIMGAHWSETQCKCVADKPTHGPSSCRSDADCRLFADYCTGCDCRALSTKESDPTCPGPSAVRCLADPCATLTAVCINGSCSAQ
jgi:hypothetical protein